MIQILHGAAIFTRLQYRFDTVMAYPIVYNITFMPVWFFTRCLDIFYTGLLNACVLADNVLFVVIFVQSFIALALCHCFLFTRV